MNWILVEVENSRFFDLVQPNFPLSWLEVKQVYIYWLILQADQICYAVLCVFSYVAAGHKKKGDLHRKPRSESMSPRGPRYSSMTWPLPQQVTVIITYQPSLLLWLYSSISLSAQTRLKSLKIKIARYLFLLTVCCTLCFSEIYISG